MSHHYPLQFTLEDGIQVTIVKTSENSYDFTLKPDNHPERHFTFVDDRPRNELIESLDFDQLNAVRKFWLLQEDMV